MSTGLLGSHVHKQRMLNKYDQLGSPQLQPQQQQQQQHNLNSFPPHPQQQQAPPQSRLQSHFAQSQPIADDDLGKKHATESYLQPNPMSLKKIFGDVLLNWTGKS